MADPFAGLLAALGAGAGSMLDQGDQQRERQYQEDAINQLISTQAPQLSKLGPSAWGNVQMDPALRQAAMQSIDKLGTVGASGGLDPQARAQIANTEGQVNAENAGRVGAINQEMQRTGRAGSGMELGAKMQAAQDASTRESAAGSNIAGQAAQRALDAYGQRAGAASEMQGQELGLAGQKAAAADAISKFNQGVPLEQYQVSQDAARTRAGADQYGAGVYGGRYGQAVDTGAGIGRAVGAGLDYATGAAAVPGQKKQGYGYGGG